MGALFVLEVAVSPTKPVSPSKWTRKRRLTISDGVRPRSGFGIEVASISNDGARQRLRMSLSDCWAKALLMLAWMLSVANTINDLL